MRWRIEKAARRGAAIASARLSNRFVTNVAANLRSQPVGESAIIGVACCVRVESRALLAGHPGRCDLSAYFASDVHLRLDRHDRSARFAHWVDRLSADDSLVIVGDLCDFWMASRQRQLNPLACAGLAALAAFRARGGSLTLLAGNHDAWMGPVYERVLGTGFVAEPLVKDVYGLRVHLAHGHKLGPRGWWKAGMESRLFLHAFANAPGVLARKLEALLDHSNDQTRSETDRRFLAAYREYADGLAGAADLVVLGHIHRPHDDRTRLPRMIVLGGWHAGSSYLRIDEQGAEFVVTPQAATPNDSRQEQHAEI